MKLLTFAERKREREILKVLGQGNDYLFISIMTTELTKNWIGGQHRIM